VKVTVSELEALVLLYAQETNLKKIRSEHAKLASGEHLIAAHEEILATSQEVSAQRTLVEEAERELQRTAADLELVEKRIDKDVQRLNQSSNPKDIQGIQHELDTLARRKDELETIELEIMESIDDLRSKLDQLAEHKRVLESELDAAKHSTKAEISSLGAQILEAESVVGKLRAEAPQDVLSVYDQRATRGVPIGKLLKSTCGACNMSLTSTALNDLHKVPSDMLARCPECTAILVRS
jgi:uncharacterized protein